MLPEVTALTAKEFFTKLKSEDFTIEDIAEHLSRENQTLRKVLGEVALSIVEREGEDTRPFDLVSFTEGILLTYGLLQYQRAINKEEEVNFVRPERFWDESEWF
jgi:hypothetical protein